jgi:hypothetical protein
VADVLIRLMFEKELKDMMMVELLEGKTVIAPPTVAPVVTLFIVLFWNFTW